MKLVINIPDEVYSFTIQRGHLPYGVNISGCIIDGVPLPKGHGRLGDLDALRDEMLTWGMNDYEPSDFIDEIDRADTIIEADKEVD